MIVEQMVAATSSVDLSDLLLKAAAFVVTGAMAYVGREMSKMRKEMIEWRVFLFGINGDDGFYSAFGRIARRVDHLERRHGPSDRRHLEDDA